MFERLIIPDSTHTAFLPSVATLQQQLRPSAATFRWIEESRQTVNAILNGQDSRRLLIVGPCSIHDSVTAQDYAIKLRELAEEVKASFYLVMRAYCEKPRSNLGWKGFLYDPDLNGSHNLTKGIYLTRRLLLDLAEMRLPAAAELLDPMMSPYLSDLLSWGCIGARTAASQIHRQLASSLSCAVGFKNDINGNISVAVSGALSASHAHHHISCDPTGRLISLHTSGNPHAHIILRGGKNGPNFHLDTIEYACQLLQQKNLTPHLLVDCSHGNAPEHESQQITVFRYLSGLFPQVSALRGLLLESHLTGGHQPLHLDQTPRPDLSITDRCLDWPSTVKLVREAHFALQSAPTDLCATSY